MQQLTSFTFLKVLSSLLSSYPDTTLAVMCDVQEVYHKERDTLALLEICGNGELGFYDVTKHWREDQFRHSWQSGTFSICNLI